MEKVISIDNKLLHLVFWKTEEEWESAYGNECCWDFLLEEILDGTVSVNEDIWYWVINGRCYETTDIVNKL